METDFDTSLRKFRQFLVQNDYPQKVEWVTPEEVLLLDRGAIYVKVPVPDANQQKVCDLFVLSRSVQ